MNTFPVMINGKKIEDGASFGVINPATGNVFASIIESDADQVDAAVSAAKNAFPAWSALTEEERADYLLKIAAVIEENFVELATLLTQETGKPLNGLNGVGSKFEVGGSMAWTQFTTSLTLPIEVIQDDDEHRVEVHYKPLGVVASIPPWNWPLLIAIWHIMPALRSGNTVVLKPSEKTPIATARFVELANTILPAGVLNLVAGDGQVGEKLVQHPEVNKIIFTGSTSTGKNIMASAASDLKRLTLELGGNDAGIVLPDVDINSVAERLFGVCFHNNGQTCAALKRLYVHESQHDALVDAFIKLANATIVGNGLEETTELGPIQNARQLNIVKDLVTSAVTEGGSIVAGGKPLDGRGYFYPPTVVTGLKDGNRLVDEEQFGPVIPIIKYTDIDEAIRSANTNKSGLGASIWSSDLEKAAELAKRFEAGSVWINDHGAVKPNAPFGGVKQSGIGVEFGQYGLKEYATIQTLHVTK